MRRRDLVKIAGSAVLASPMIARAQSTKKLPVVAFILPALPLADMAGLEPRSNLARAFVHRLRELGWVEDHSVVIERRSAEGRIERVPAIIADLMSREVDVIVVGAALWLIRAVNTAMRGVPTVAFFGGVDPVSEGLIASISRPNSNLTGVTSTTSYELFAKQLQFLREFAPGIARVGVLGRKPEWEALESYSASLGINSIFAEVDRGDQLEAAFAKVLREQVDALHCLSATTLFVEAPRIAAFAIENRLPSIHFAREAVAAGGLMSYGPMIPGLFRQLAEYVDKILKGASPAAMPVEQPSRFELVVNLKTARALGVALPATITAWADETID